jgi:trk system potassium uptake protein TrkA
MYVIVIGAGEVGCYLATILIEEGHEVAVIELDEALARQLDARLNGMVVTGSGLTHEAMERAGIRNADLVLGVTAVDEVNLISCMIAERANPRVRSVARVRGEQYYAAEHPTLLAKDLGLDLIMSPERAVADEVLELVQYAGPGEMRRLVDDRLVLVGMHLARDSTLVKGSLAELRARMPRQSLVVAVEGRNGFRIPRGPDRMDVDERAYVLTVPEHVETFVKLSGVSWSPIKNVLIVGCGDIGFAVVRELEKRGIRPIILERDEERAQWVAAKVSGSLVIHGDGTNLGLLRERIEEDFIDAAAILMDDDEKSLVLGLFAKSLGAKKIICRCDNLDYGPFANRLGVDAMVTPKRAVANAILRHVRRGQVQSTVVLGNHEAEIIHFTVPDRPRHKELITRPLKDLPSPREALVGAVVRKGDVFVPTGDTVLQAGDSLLIATLPKALHAVDRLLAES